MPCPNHFSYTWGEPGKDKGTEKLDDNNNDDDNNNNNNHDGNNNNNDDCDSVCHTDTCPGRSLCVFSV